MKITLKQILVVFLITSFTQLGQAQFFGGGDTLKEDTFVNLAEKLTPSVVTVAITFDPRMAPQNMQRDPFWDFFERFYGIPQGGPVSSEPRPVGTGFIIESTGLILTNNHVASAGAQLKVQLYKEKEY